jgi:hypothetical protein
MARRNPGISPILSARGYGARVLWPQYTPDGGINSGSEIPVPPRNTLQSNQSNLIYHENPFTPVTKNAPGRIQVTSKRGKTLYMTENQILKMGSKMLADGEIERALGRSNPNAYKAGKGEFRRETKKSTRRAHYKAAAEAEQEGLRYYPDDYRPLGKFYQTGVPQTESEANRRSRETYEFLQQSIKKNPFWVTPQGTAVHHSDKAWAGYQDKNAGVRLPAMAEREALLERQPANLAPGFTVRVESIMTSNGRSVQAHKLFYKGQDTGKYALDARKAIEISHSIDPETGKRRKA